WIEKDLVEVPDHDGESGEDSFVVVDRGGDVNPPARKQVADPDLGPEHDAGKAHQGRAPDQRPVFGFLSVVKPAERRLLLADAEVVEHGANAVKSVVRTRCNVEQK